jgi:hypothetical protein
MDIQFIGFENTGWLEQRRYRKIMLRWIEDQISALPEVYREVTLRNINKFRFRFFPTTMYKTMYGEYKYLTNPLEAGTSISDNIPHEKMGQFELDLFILDNKGDLQFASNVIMMSHGLGHVVLYSYDPNRRILLRERDLSGNKRGTEMNWSTAAVHNRTNAIEQSVQKINDPEIDNQIYYMETYRFKNGFWRKTYYRMFDFRDDLR